MDVGHGESYSFGSLIELQAFSPAYGVVFLPSSNQTEQGASHPTSNSDTTATERRNIRAHVHARFLSPKGWTRLLLLDVYRCIRSGDYDDDASIAVELSADLVPLGYSGARVCKAQGNDVRTMRHEYIEVTCLDQCSEFQGASVVVDPRFRQQFCIPRTTERYAEVLSAVPEVFVGTRASLRLGVEHLSSEMARAFRETGLTLPPWRTPRSMLAKWNDPRACTDVHSQRQQTPAHTTEHTSAVAPMVASTGIDPPSPECAYIGMSVFDGAATRRRQGETIREMERMRRSIDAFESRHPD